MPQFKGQLISKRFFGVTDFLQKTNERIRLYYFDTSVRLVFVRFLEEIDDPKNHFEINWPLKKLILIIFHECARKYSSHVWKVWLAYPFTVVISKAVDEES